jgi:hypothetical protein
LGDGTYIPLRNKHAGFSAFRVWTEDSTNDLYKKRQLRVGALFNEVGVNTLQFKLVDKKPLTFSKGRCVKSE